MIEHMKTSMGRVPDSCGGGRRVVAAGPGSHSRQQAPQQQRTLGIDVESLPVQMPSRPSAAFSSISFAARGMSICERRRRHAGRGRGRGGRTPSPLPHLVSEDEEGRRREEVRAQQALRGRGRDAGEGGAQWGQGSEGAAPPCTHVELPLRLWEALPVHRVDEVHDGVHLREVRVPELPGCARGGAAG